MSSKSSSRPAKGPKNTKADGSKKKRWTAAERAARGHQPRRGGGRPRSEAGAAPDRAPRWDDRGPAAPRREDRRPVGDDRRPRTDRPVREERYPRDERGTGRGDRFRRDERPRGDRSDRDDRFGRRDRDDRFGRRDRDDRPRGERYDRTQRYDRGERNDRGERYDRDERYGRRERDDRFDRGGRPERRDDRFERRDDRRDERSDERDHHRRASRPAADQHGARRFESRPHRFAERSRSEQDGGRDDRRWDERDRRPRRDEDRSRQDRRPEWQQETGYEAGDSDQMEWTPTVAAEVDPETQVVVEGPGFADLGLPSPLVNALAAQQITTPFPIQAATIPDALAGRDVLGRGQTGSGKTLGFGLPMLSRLAEGARGTTRGVVLVPTRELAMQVADVLSPLAGTVGLSVVLVAGGMAYGPQLKAFDRGVDVVVATPGRLIDLMDQGAADLTDVEVTVLDEADHMADLGFLPDVRRVLDSVPAGGQRLLFSATLDRGVGTVVREYLQDPVTHEVDSGRATVSTMAHHVFQVKPADKQTITAEVANRDGRTVVFVRTQRGADRVAGQLREAGVMAGALHGGLTQGARSRILGAFKAGTVPVLVATDVAARGIHVDEVSLVLQVDPPMGSKDYLHRAGRTARAGGEGVVVTLALPHQRREVARLLKQAGVKTMATDVATDDERVYRATGARKPARPAIEDHEYETLIAPPVKARGSRRPGGHRSGGPRGRGSFRGSSSRPGRGRAPEGAHR